MKIIYPNDEEVDQLEYLIDMRTKNQRKNLILLGFLTIFFAIFAMGFGSSESLDFYKIIKIILGIDEPTDTQSVILLKYRLPRVMMAILAGAALATAGALMQKFRQSTGFTTYSWCCFWCITRCCYSNNIGNISFWYRFYSFCTFHTNCFSFS